MIEIVLTAKSVSFRSKRVLGLSFSWQWWVKLCRPCCVEKACHADPGSWWIHYIWSLAPVFMLSNQHTENWSNFQEWDHQSQGLETDTPPHLWFIHLVWKMQSQANENACISGIFCIKLWYSARKIIVSSLPDEHRSKQQEIHSSHVARHIVKTLSPKGHLHL